MSVGIIQIPNLYEPAYNPNYYVVSGTHSASGNYKLMARLQIPSGTIVAKLKTPVDPNMPKTAVFDVHRIIESYVTHTIDIGIDRVTNAEDNIIEYLIEFGEEYNNAGESTPSEHWYSTFEYPMYGINVALSPREFNAYDDADYLPTNTTSKFLNKYKGVRRVFTTSKAFLYFLSDQSHDLDRIVISAYDSAGSLIGSASKIDRNISGLLRYFPAGPSNLNLIPQSQITIGTAGSIIPANTKTYTIYLELSGNRVSETMTYEIVENCSKYTNYPIYFLGQFGNMELQNFNRRSDKVSEVERQKFKKPLGKWLNEFREYGYENTDRQDTVYNTEVRDSVTLNSDYLSEAEYEFMKECVQSPVVYSLEGGVLIPVTVKDTQFNWKVKANEKLFNCSITIEYASTLELQRA